MDHKANILIDELGNPRLTDFGLSWMLIDATIWITTRKDGAGTARYMAPELHAAEDGEESLCSTEKSDIYAYAMTSWVGV